MEGSKEKADMVDFVDTNSTCKQNEGTIAENWDNDSTNISK